MSTNFNLGKEEPVRYEFILMLGEAEQLVDSWEVPQEFKHGCWQQKPC